MMPRTRPRRASRRRRSQVGRPLPIRALLGFVWTLGTVPACGTDTVPDFSAGDPQLATGASQPAPLPSEGLDLRRATCLHELGGTLSVEVRRTLLAESGEHVSPGTESWVPGRIVDLVQIPGGFVVIDGGSAEVVFLSPELEVVHRWGRRGQGPGEFVNPVAAALDPAGDTIWILDGALGRVTGFDLSGTYLRDFRVAPRGHDLAITADGTFFVSTMVMVPMLDMGARESLDAVVAYQRNGEINEPFLVVHQGSAQPPRFNLPGPTPVRLEALGDALAIVFPAAGIVDLYENGELVSQSSVCLPDDVVEAYRQQREAGPQSQTQRWFASATGVSRPGPQDGPVWIYVPVPAEGGERHLVRTHIRSGLSESILLQGDTAVLSAEMRFLRDGLGLYGFTTGGDLVVVELR